MKKAFVLIVLILSACDYNSKLYFGNNVPIEDNQTTDDLKLLSPKCRKVHLVVNGWLSAHSSMDKNEHTKSIIHLCVAHTLYQMEFSTINQMVEIDGVYESKVSALYDFCTNFVLKEGDRAHFFLALEGDDTLKEYIKENRDECWAKQ